MSQQRSASTAHLLAMYHFGSRPLRFHVGFILASWLLGQTRTARAENAIAYKYEDYRESGGRIQIQTQGAQVDQDLTPDLHLKLSGIIDAIAGATPTGAPIADGSQQVPLTEMHDRRKAWDVGLSRQFSRVNVSLGYANSRESDYVSHGVSLNTLTDFNEKNTTVLLGVAGSDDDVKVFNPPGWDKKRSRDFIAGVTQLIDPLTSVTLNVTWGRSSGYLADPYRIVSRDIEIFSGVVRPLVFPENRPDTREKAIGLLGLNRSFPAAHGALDATYRYYRDTFGTDAHTVELAWLQNLGERFILQPSFRSYAQSAANFYHYNLNTDNVPLQLGLTQAPGLFYSSDYRLSHLATTTVGLQGIWQVATAWQLDAALEQYDMRGRDHVTPRSAYPRARIVTAGAKFSW